MELRSLRYLISVVDSGSVTAAAAEVRVAQPSLSRQIRQLERELGLDLFDRRNGRLFLTPAGRRFLPVARDLIGRSDTALAAAAAFAAGRLDQITIAAPRTTMTDVIAPFVATLGPNDPFTSIIETDPPAVYQTLTNQADLALSTEPPPPQLATKLVATLPIWLYIRADHPWSDRSQVTLGELADQELLLLPTGFTPRQAIDAAAATAGIRLPLITEVRSGEIAQALTAAGRGLSVVSDDPRFGLIGLPIHSRGDVLTVDLHAGWDAGHHAASALEALVIRLCHFCIDRYGTNAGPVR